MRNTQRNTGGGEALSRCVLSGVIVLVSVKTDRTLQHSLLSEILNDDFSAIPVNGFQWKVL